MSRIINISGQRFGRLIVLHRGYRPNDWRVHWECQCDCGTRRLVNSDNLRRGKVQSCGCLLREFSATVNYKHGDTHTKEHRAWLAMIKRCYDKNDKAYPRYGGRGITVYEPWRLDYITCLRAIGRAPSPHHSIDRIDNNGNYEPGNVRWATATEQANNTRRNRRLTFDERTLSISQWERELGYRPGTLKRRVYLGWSVERVLTTPAAPWHGQRRP